MLARYFLGGRLLAGGLLAWLVMSGQARAGYVDGTGTTVPLGLNASRIVCLAPNVTEMLWFIGLGERQVGRSDFCDYPPDARSIRQVGGFADTSLELVAALQPDLVVAYQGNSLELVAQLRQLRITVLAFREASSLDEIGAQMEALYRVAAARDAALPEALSDWRARLSDLTAAGYRKYSVFYGYPGELTYTCGPGSFLADLIERAGGINVGAGLESRWPQVSAEFILAAKPEVLLTATSCHGKESLVDARRRLQRELLADKVWRDLPAVRSGHIVLLDSGVLLRPGPRILDALETLADALAGWQ